MLPVADSRRGHGFHQVLGSSRHFRTEVRIIEHCRDQEIIQVELSSSRAGFVERPSNVLRLTTLFPSSSTILRKRDRRPKQQVMKERIKEKGNLRGGV